MKLLGYFLLGLLPGLFWMWFYLRKDREKPEPIKLIAKVFLFGMAATFPAIALEFAIDYFFPFSGQRGLVPIILGSLLVVAPVEELLKYVVVRDVVFKDPHFDEPVDGIMYAVVAALGFASLENLLVVFSEGGTVLLLRFATATLMHALTSGIVGYYIGRGMIEPEKKKAYIRQGLFLAILLHALYNISVSLSSNLILTIVLVTVLLGAMFYILSQGIKELKLFTVKRRVE
ncbi:PrsW family intramembrane metalloprotease [Patescibacteria group bacterium]|nr:PrsW family intramembrane metalloprotease [Patescibacteria group bacterium]